VSREVSGFPYPQPRVFPLLSPDCAARFLGFCTLPLDFRLERDSNRITPLENQLVVNNRLRAAPAAAILAAICSLARAYIYSMLQPPTHHRIDPASIEVATQRHLEASSTRSSFQFTSAPRLSVLPPLDTLEFGKKFSDHMLEIDYNM
ncbi:branched-chain-amino-acid aminotransferase, partial [Perkinsus olseni]